MPDYSQILKGLMNPMMPKRAISGMQEGLAPGSSADIEGGVMDLPGAFRDLMDGGMENPMETMGGFASGAMEGLRGMTTPLDALSLMAPGALGLLGRAGGAVDDGVRMGRQAFDVVEDLPRPQSMPSMQDADDLIGDLQRNMARVPNATGQMRRPSFQQPPAQMPPEFVPRGGEGVYNAARPRSIGPDIQTSPTNKIEEELKKRFAQMGPR
jgi:hypothetical protein